jgi:L-rhamnose-H+ transport protein
VEQSGSQHRAPFQSKEYDPMQSNLTTGFLLVVAAGAMVGNCMLPFKCLRTWKWEGAWMVFTLVSLLVVPWAVAFAAVPGLLSIYAACSIADLLPSLLFGFAWGIAQVLFGITVTNLGMALGFAIVISLGSTFGTLVPLLVQRPEVMASSKGALLLTGMVVMLAGTAVCSYAGRLRERAEVGAAHYSRARFKSAMVLAVVCGVLAPMINFGFAFGGGIVRQATHFGVAPGNTGFVVWPAVLGGGLLPNIGYAGYLLTRNRKWGLFRVVWPDVGWSMLAGLLWIGATFLYGIASRHLGALGTSAGWGLYQVLMIVSANVSGLVTGEWSAAGRRPVRILLAGLALLGVATLSMSLANK